MSAEPLIAAPAVPPVAEAGPPRRETLWLFAKEQEGRLSGNFALGEFRCTCRERGCHYTLIHPRLVETLQTLREMLARPLVLTSGFRCIAHNRNVGGRLRSFHTRGMAADIRCGGLAELEELTEAARRIPAVGGLGSYPAKGFLHLDLRPRAAGGGIVEWSL